MLPGRDGFSILRRLRQAKVNVPVLVLTARSEIDDRVGALDLGADDYLVKPFAFAELLARLDAVCRRSVNLQSMVLKAGPLTLDLSTRRVTRGKSELELTPTEFSLLEFLMRYAGQVVTRKMLCEHLFPGSLFGWYLCRGKTRSCPALGKVSHCI